MRKTLLVRKTLPLVGMVMITLVALGGVASASHDFSDVPDASPFHEDISWMAASGITEGFPDGTFRPGEPVTRQAMAAFMRRLAGDDPDVAPMVDAAQLNGRGSADYDNAVSLNGRPPADYDNAVTLDGRAPSDYDNAVSLNGRTPADFDDAVTLGGRTPADYDNAVTLNGRTPADYDDAVTLAGRTPADFDNAVTLNGRTPADYDDAVTLAGNTPADFDDAESVQGLTPINLLPQVGLDDEASVTITGTTGPTATPVVSSTIPNRGFGYFLIFTALVDTSHDSLLLTCKTASGNIPGLTSIKVGDGAVGHADRFTISTVFALAGSGTMNISCFAENKVGSGTLVLVDPTIVMIETSSQVS